MQNMILCYSNVVEKMDDDVLERIKQLPYDVQHYMQQFLCIDHRRAIGAFNKVQVPPGLIEKLERMPKLHVTKPTGYNLGLSLGTRVLVNLNDNISMMLWYYKTNRGKTNNVIGTHFSPTNLKLQQRIKGESW